MDSGSGADVRRSEGLQRLLKMRLSVSSDSCGEVGQDAQLLEGLQQTPPPSTTTSMMSSPQPSSATPGSSLTAPARTQVDRKESYKAQRKTYAKEKKRVERELLSTFKDQSIIVLADWLKVRGSLKSWTKLWCVLKPGLLLLYRSQKAKSSHWIGTIILSTCELIERPSKKDGFCFKLFHPMDQSIWAARGPDGEAYGAVVQPLPTSHLIFRAPNNAAGKCWMDALELALRCSSLLLRTMTKASTSSGSSAAGFGGVGTNGDADIVKVKSDSDAESQFKADLDLEELMASADVPDASSTIFADDGDDEEMEDETSGEGERRKRKGTKKGRRRLGSNESDYSDDTPFHEEDELESELEPELTGLTPYLPDPSAEVFGSACDQTEEFSEENKSIVWYLVKQVRPGMDLSRVVLPTFILEPRSFLDKLSDYHYHNDLLALAVKEESPFNRMKLVVKWYLSGFYKKPKGLKKPYNPILGEAFRCYWENSTGSKTFFIAEQVSHHPPISAFYVANRQDGFTISSSILAKSKFYGNSTSAILDGTATLSLLPRGEDYRLTMPYAHCKGILMGTLTMELGGKVNIECSKTGYSCELEFKLRPFLGGGEFTNAVAGKLRLGKETLMTIDGHWDDCVKITDKKTGNEEILWQVTQEVRQSRLRRFTVPIEHQGEFESVRLWQKVSKAIELDDQKMATDEKFVLEEAQRAGARERKALGVEWTPKHFLLNHMTGQYEYRHSDLRPWDPLNDLFQYEKDFIISTKTRHKTPMIRTQSIISVSEAGKTSSVLEGQSPSKASRRRRSTKENVSFQKKDVSVREATGQQTTTTTDGEASEIESITLSSYLRPLEEQQRITNERLTRLQHSIDVMSYQQKERDSNSNINRDMVLLVVLVVMIQAILNWVLTQKAQEQFHQHFGGDGESQK